MLRKKYNRSLLIGIIAFSLLILIVLFFSNDKEKSKRTKNDVHAEVVRPDTARIASIKNELRKYTVDFDSPVFLQSGIVKSDDTIINSNFKFSIIPQIELLREFPFEWSSDGPVVAIPILLFKVNGIYVINIAYEYGSTRTHQYDNYLFTYTSNGKFIDVMRLPSFNYGIGDAEVITRSNFVKKYRSAGFSEIKVFKNKLDINSTKLRVYSNKTEELTIATNVVLISKAGAIHNVFSNQLKAYYFKDGMLDTILDTVIKKYSAERSALYNLSKLYHYQCSLY